MSVLLPWQILLYRDNIFFLDAKRIKNLDHSPHGNEKSDKNEVYVYTHTKSLSQREVWKWG